MSGKKEEVDESHTFQPPKHNTRKAKFLKAN